MRKSLGSAIVRFQIVVLFTTCATFAACFGGSNGTSPSSPDDSGTAAPDTTVEASGPAPADASLEATVSGEASPVDAASEAAAADAASEAAAVDAASEAAAVDASSEAAAVDAASEAAPVDAASGEGDAGTQDSGDSDSGGACSIVGTWTGTYSCAALDGETYTWVISSDGTATGTITGQGTVQQTWSLSGDTFSINTDSSCGSGVGTYTLAFNASCTQMTLTETSDLCTGRGSCVDGLTSTRQ